MNDTPLISAAQMSQTCALLNAQRTARLLARRYDAALATVGLTGGQFSLLAALNQPQPVPLTRLAGLLGMERTTLTRNLAPLERAKLVVQNPVEGDRRVRALSLSNDGRKRLAAAMPFWSAANARSGERLAGIGWQVARAVFSALANET